MKGKVIKLAEQHGISLSTEALFHSTCILDWKVGLAESELNLMDFWEKVDLNRLRKITAITFYDSNQNLSVKIISPRIIAAIVDPLSSVMKLDFEGELTSAKNIRKKAGRPQDELFKHKLIRHVLELKKEVPHKFIAELLDVSPKTLSNLIALHKKAR